MHGKVLWIRKRERNEDIWFDKTNGVINKRAAGIMWKCKNVLYLLKKIFKTNMWKMKNIVNLEIIAITLGNTHVLHIAYKI